MRGAYRRGFSNGVPIALGYLSVSFGFGILAVRLNISTLGAVLISLTNLTSAGQAAGVEIIASAGTAVEMALTQLVINLRYALMGFSLTQKLDESFTTPKRLLLSFGITDEIYAIAVARNNKISAAYMAGLMTLPIIGWTSGTLLGAVAGQFLPKIIADAMGIMLYGMFIAIIFPVSRSDKRVLAVVGMAALFSILFKYVLTFISSGFAVIVSALLASVICALLFPIKEEDV